MGLLRSTAEMFGVLLAAVIGAHVARQVGATVTELVAAAFTAALVYAWGVVKIHERARGRIAAGRTFGVVKAE